MPPEKRIIRHGIRVDRHEQDVRVAIENVLRPVAVMIVDIENGNATTGLAGVLRSDRGLRDLCHTRHVNYDRVGGWARDPFWFPYSKKTERQLKAILANIFVDKPWSRWIRRAIS